ncbi:hypothetical protein OB69_14510 [Roseivirga seohaensis subsp. aquiponti]|uniref:6-bladed beta-propeller n=1 Tax=Roseivirga seohaensis subsp. aquiponti TaxID=1566026 RepID=A0A0L8AI59_9BACT|nr:6-bladed beta-propeller [Roseivirga seohaensis]KOF01947.1 hypothetical protein OB69_14510 [Roseivirga seohaensis subsp. aquiponti]
MKKPLSLLPKALLLFILFNCSGKSETTESSEFIPYEIDLSPEAYHQAEQPKSSLLLEKIEYVALETTERCRVKEDFKVYASNEYIYTVASGQILQFDRKDGKFIKELGKYRNGTEGYVSTLPYVQSLNSNQILVTTNDHLSKINGVTNELTNISPISRQFQDVAELNANTLVSFIAGDESKLKSNLLIFSKDGTERNRLYLNQSDYDPSNFIKSLGFHEGNFNYYNNEVFFKQIYNDTIYKVSEEGLKPYVHFNLGEFAIDWNNQIIRSDVFNKISIIKTFESEDYLFFNYRYKAGIKYGVYSKNSKVSYLPENTWTEDGFIDDVYGFIDFRPQSMNEHNEMVASFPPFEILFFINSYGKEVSLPKSIDALRTVKEDDNPVIGIATLK